MTTKNDSSQRVSLLSQQNDDVAEAFSIVLMLSPNDGSAGYSLMSPLGLLKDWSKPVENSTYVERLNPVR